MTITLEEASAPTLCVLSLCLQVIVHKELVSQRRLLGPSAQGKHERQAAGEPLYVGMHEKIWKQATNMPVGLCFQDD